MLIWFNACRSDDEATPFVDSDDDGVVDDTCANTPLGETVNADGCSDSQKDTDQDGISDDMDTCENTDEGKKVDATGCTIVIENLIYLNGNGITIRTDTAAIIGESYELDGISYLIVDSTILYQMINDSLDVTKVITSFVTDMSYMFPSSNFNQNISHWDISNVKNIRVMFYYYPSFNQDIGTWDVSNVTDMSGTFSSSTSFNQDLSGWEVSNVIRMGGMFSFASSFNQDLSAWVVHKVIDCNKFSINTTTWTTPKTNFTNCLE